MSRDEKVKTMTKSEAVYEVMLRKHDPTRCPYEDCHTCEIVSELQGAAEDERRAALSAPEEPAAPSNDATCPHGVFLQACDLCIAEKKAAPPPSPAQAAKDVPFTYCGPRMTPESERHLQNVANAAAAQLTAQAVEEREFYACCGRLSDEGHAMSCSTPAQPPTPAPTREADDARDARNLHALCCEKDAELASLRAELDALRGQLTEAKSSYRIAYTARSTWKARWEKVCARLDWRRELYWRERERRYAAESRADAAEKERDLAIAHDRQPYPTADAYDKACAAIEKHRTRADAAEKRAEEAERERDEVRGSVAGFVAKLAVAEARAEIAEAALNEAGNHFDHDSAESAQRTIARYFGAKETA